MPKEVLYNKKNKADLLNDLKNEAFNRVTLSFYKYTKLKSLEKLRDSIYKNWFNLNILGRVYIAKEGINAQLSVPEFNWDFFTKNLSSYALLQDIPLKIAVEDDGKSFFKLTIKVREQIVADGLPVDEYDVTNVGKHLSAEEWNKSME